MTISVSADLLSVRCVLAWTVFENVAVTGPTEDLRRAITQEQERCRLSLDLVSLYADPGIIESRRCFKAVGLDPARYRPSQEALLRRVLSKKEMYFINTGVDACNLLSLRYRVPMGLYDLDRIAGDVRLRIGTDADVYAALNERDVSADGKLILCDTQGPIGSPYVDSKRTAVTEGTKNFLHIVYFCYDGLTSRSFADMQQVFVTHCAGRGSGYQIIR